MLAVSRKLMRRYSGIYADPAAENTSRPCSKKAVPQPGRRATGAAGGRLLLSWRGPFHRAGIERERGSGIAARCAAESPPSRRQQPRRAVGSRLAIIYSVIDEEPPCISGAHRSIRQFLTDIGIMYGFKRGPCRKFLGICRDLSLSLLV